MTIFEHPIFMYIRPYAHIVEGRDNLDFLQMPDQLRSIALEVVCNCVACGAVIHPLRARALSDRSRVAGTATERRLFYAPTCPTEKNPGCSRTRSAQEHKDVVKARLQSTTPVRAPRPTRVVNLRREPYDVYIGRAGHGLDGTFGNPFAVGQVCAACGKHHRDNASTIVCFKTYFLARVENDADFRSRVLSLKGKVLGCFCKPAKPCHGDVIAEWLDRG